MKIVHKVQKNILKGIVQKLVTYIFAADSMGFHAIMFE